MRLGIISNLPGSSTCSHGSASRRAEQAKSRIPPFDGIDLEIICVRQLEDEVMRVMPMIFKPVADLSRFRSFWMILQSMQAQGIREEGG
jgi:hypothetical protein